MRVVRLLMLAAVALLLAGRGSGSEGSGSPTGAVVFDFEGDLFAVAADGSRRVRLTATRDRETAPSVSPDGRSIAYSRSSSGRPDGLWIMSPDGSGLRRLSPEGPLSAGWLPSVPAAG
jgi:WD40-like Beta Propeller Repeat